MKDSRWKHFAFLKMFSQAHTWSAARSDIQVLLKYSKSPWDPSTVLQGVLYLKALLYTSIFFWRELISFSYSITNDVNNFHSKLGFAIPPFSPKLQCVLQTNSSRISIYEWIKLLLSELFDNGYNKRWHLQSYSAINIKRSARHIFH